MPFRLIVTLFVVLIQNSFNASLLITFFFVNSSAHNSSGHLPCKTLPFEGLLFRYSSINLSNNFLKSSNCIICSFLISFFSFSGLSVILPPRYPTKPFERNSFIFKKSLSTGFVWAL